MLVRISGYAVTFLLGALGAAASSVAVLGYKGPASFPVVKGLDITLCQLLDPGKEANIANQKRLMTELEARNRQIVFLTDLAIYNYSCWPSDVKRKPTDKARAGYSNEFFEYVDSDLKEKDGAFISGSVTVGLKKLYKNPPVIFEQVWLVVATPGKEQYFSDSNCGENCFGAHGLYKISLSSAEGYTIFRADPIPVTSGVFAAYQCTVDRLNAKTAWQQFAACRF